MRTRIWTNLVNLRFKVYYIDGLVDRFQKRDRNLNIFLALVSFGSISAWAVWDAVPWLWGLILAISHVVNAIKPYLPFHKYVKELNSKFFLTQEIQHEFERLWYESENGLIKDTQVADKFFALQKKAMNALRFSDDIVLSENKEIKEKADLLTKTYIESNFNVTVNIER